MGGIGFNIENGLFVEMLLKYNKKYWNYLKHHKKKNRRDKDYLEPIEKIQTHTTYAKAGDMHFWCHPLDLHFQASAINGWPKCVFRVWRVDDANKIDIRKVSARFWVILSRFIWNAKPAKNAGLSRNRVQYLDSIW